MRIGVPKEIKTQEGRIALVPAAVGEIVARGHTVSVQAGAGVVSGYSDDEYRRAGAELVPDAKALYERAQLIVKVKEPIEPEFALLKHEHVLFSYLHLAANLPLAKMLQDKRLTAVAFETVSVGGKLPLLAPMSDIAGRLAVHIGLNLLHTRHGGRGLLLGGLPAAERGRVVVLGAGEAGGNAARVAAALGAEVVVFARTRESLERMHALGPNVTALTSYPHAIAEAVAQADLLIGAVLIPGARAPMLVTRDMVKRMRPGAVIVDIAIDQGGCIETIRPTTYADPTYIEEGVVHFGVTNMPGAVPRTSAQALSAAITPYVLRLAQYGLDDGLLVGGVNVRDGAIVHPAVAEAVDGQHLAQRR